MEQSIISDFFKAEPKLSVSMKEFIKWLGKNAPSDIDSIVHEIHDDVFEEVDCLQCANCCKTVGPAIKDVDIDRLSKFLRIKPSKLIDDYLIMDEDFDYIFRNHPCPFLMTDNYCSVYDSRPKACREYPHTDRRRVMQIINLHKKNIEYCPAVYEVFTRLKKKFGK